MAQIVIVGAGLGGLSFAYHYTGTAKLILIEKEKKEDLGFPWHDSVKLDVFKQTNYPLPPFGVCSKKTIEMYSPNGENHLPQRKKTVSSGAEISRKYLISHAINLVETKVEMHFGTTVQKIQSINNGYSLKLNNGKSIDADLIIDASGGFSTLRQYVMDDPSDFMPLEDEILYTTRAMYKIPTGTKLVEKDASYIKHLGVPGVAWCRTAPESNNMDVFVSSLGKPLTSSMIEESENDMRKHNSAFSYDLVNRRNEKLALRYPLSQCVYDNYVAVGDSAYSSNPVNGCGIENALRSGFILAEVLNTKSEYTISNLWEYQFKYMHSIGADLVFLDIIKRWVFEVTPEDINWLFNTLLGEDVLSHFNNKKHKKDFDISILLDKMPIAWSRKDLFSFALSAFSTAASARMVALMVPPVYEKKLVLTWRKKYNSYIREHKYIKG